MFLLISFRRINARYLLLHFALWKVPVIHVECDNHKFIDSMFLKVQCSENGPDVLQMSFFRHYYRPCNIEYDMKLIFSACNARVGV